MKFSKRNYSFYEIDKQSRNIRRRFKEITFLRS